jgi:hypothetical protein
MCFVLNRDNKIVQIPIPLDERISKDIVAAFIKMMVKATKPLAIVFITEAWVSMRNTDKDDAKVTDDLMKGRIAVKDQPNKSECIMIVQETPESCVGVMIPIFKGDKGAYYGEEISHPNIGGRFANFFRS